MNNHTDKKFDVIVYHHTHWDREWWATMQDFRIRLTELIDGLLEELDEDPEFKCFLLDGQTIVLKDYLEVRPESKERLTGYIREGRIQCGPWYILPDEFLVSGESHIRNLLLGERMAQAYGIQNLDVGYIPDTFGHISQIPQLFQGFGIDNALVWRGLGGPEGDCRQEFWWEGPDGTRVLSCWFPDGYYVVDFLHFDNPAKTWDETYGRVKRSLDRWAATSSADVLLMPYGGDHRLTDKRLARLIRQANEDEQISSKYNIRWGSTQEYIQVLRRTDADLPVRKGELRQFGLGLPHMLPGVLSARMYLKRMNFYGQSLLERFAEPMSALAWLSGRRYDSGLLWAAWELLIQNHPHDSICGCSIDQVHREMLPRFDQSAQIAEILTEKSAQHLNACINTSDLAEGEEAVIVHNTLPWERTGTASLRVDRHKGIHPRSHILRDEEGNEVPFDVKDWEGRIGTNERWWHTEIRLPAAGVPGLGYRTYKLAKREKLQDDKRLYFQAVQPSAKLKGSEALTYLTVGNHVLENQYLRVEVNLLNGTLRVTDKANGLVYDGLNAFEDGGDAGDTYNYSYPLGDHVLRTDEKVERVHVSVADAGYAAATLRVDVDWLLPKELSEDRLSRSADYVNVRISSFVTLAAQAKRVDIRTEIDNRAEDHRLRVLFPLGTAVEATQAEGHFDVMERPTAVTDWGNGWEEPYVPQQPQQGYVSVSDSHGKKGFTVANKGLPEFEALRDVQGTIAITLVRAVGWVSREDMLLRVGGAGPYSPTPDAQMQGIQVAEYSFIPHEGTVLSSKAYLTAHEYMAPLYGSLTGKHEGTEPGRGGLIDMQGTHTLLLSACKKAEQRDTLLLRFWNVAKAHTQAKVKLGKPVKAARYVNLKEEPVPSGELQADADGALLVSAGPAQIVTMEIEF